MVETFGLNHIGTVNLKEINNYYVPDPVKVA